MPRTEPQWMVQTREQAQQMADRIGASYDECYAMLSEGGDEYTIPIIKRYLRTPQQKAILDALDLSIEDILNGRVNQEQLDQVAPFFADWNEKLGTRQFGY